MLSFFIFVSVLIIFDLCILNRTNKNISFNDSLKQSIFFIGAGLSFGVWIYYSLGYTKMLEYYNGYLVELALSIDNIFIISLIFVQFNVDKIYQRRALFWGIISAIIFRGIMIYCGVALISNFSWVMHIFALILIYTSIHLYQNMDKVPDLQNNPIAKIIVKYIPIYNKQSSNFFIYDKRWFITRTGISLCMIECMDLIFAVDSIPAIFAITTDTYLVYSSNIFAIMGLRSMYFCLSGIIEKFKYIKYSLVIILFLIGIKILLHPFVKFSPLVPLLMTVLIFGAGILTSLYYKPKGRASV